MITNYDDVKQLNSERLRESNRDKAEKYKAVSEADRINSWNRFKLVHSGAAAIARNDVYFDCRANEDLIELFLDVEELSITLDTLEYAFKENRKRLAQFPKQQYERKTNVAVSGRNPMQQQRSFAPPPLALPYTREEILSWSKGRLKQEVSKSPRHLDAVNRILAGQI